MSVSEKTSLHLPQSEIHYYPHFLQQNFADRVFDSLLKEVSWRQDDIKVFGKTYPQPRLTAFFAENKASYSYSNIRMEPETFPIDIVDIKNKIENEISAHFTNCLANLYRDGSDSNGWHADDEKELGSNPIIASVSLGAERYFHFRHKKDSSLKRKLLLEHGSLLIMAGETQHFWKHQLPKTKKKIGERINLTFRIIPS